MPINVQRVWPCVISFVTGVAVTYIYTSSQSLSSWAGKAGFVKSVIPYVKSYPDTHGYTTVYPDISVNQSMKVKSDPAKRYSSKYSGMQASGMKYVPMLVDRKLDTKLFKGVRVPRKRIRYLEPVKAEHVTTSSPVKNSDNYEKSIGPEIQDILSDKDNVTEGSDSEIDIEDIIADSNNDNDISQSVTTTTPPADILNPFNFKYIHKQADKCDSGNLRTLFCSPSRPGDFSKRNKVRRKRQYLIDKPGLTNMNHAAQLFFLGISKSGNSMIDKYYQDQIDKEASQYHDIIQMDYVDVYGNLTYKTMAMLTWVSTYCNSATFAIKTDTDVIIEEDNLVKGLEHQYQSKDTFIIGRLGKKAQPIRDRRSKWHVPVSLYAESRYPTFTFGPTYGFTVSAARPLFEASLRLPFFYLEDVFITGLCARKANISHVSDPLFEYRHY